MFKMAGTGRSMLINTNIVEPCDHMPSSLLNQQMAVSGNDFFLCSYPLRPVLVGNRC